MKAVTWLGAMALAAIVGCGSSGKPSATADAGKDDAVKARGGKTDAGRAGSGSPLDPDTFAGMNAASIQYDCAETRQCQDDNGDKPATNFVDSCIKMESSFFANHPEGGPCS